MCDDYFDDPDDPDDLDDDSIDFDNCLEEELADKIDEGGFEEGEIFMNEIVGNAFSAGPKNNPEPFDLDDAIKLGIIGGLASDAIDDEVEKKKLIQSEDRHKK